MFKYVYENHTYHFKQINLPRSSESFYELVIISLFTYPLSIYLTILFCLCIIHFAYLYIHLDVSYLLTNTTSTLIHSYFYKTQKISRSHEIVLLHILRSLINLLCIV